MSLIENQKGKIKVLLPLFIVVLAAGLMLFLSKFKDEKKVKEVLVSERFVSAIPVKYHEVNTTLIAFGKVSSASSVHMIAEASGVLQSGQVSLKKAVHFSKNQLLYSVANEESILQLKAQKSDFLQLVSSILPDMKVDYQDSYKNWDNYLQQIEVNKPLPELPEFKSKKEKSFIAARKILSMYFNIKSLEEKVGKNKFYAPYNGSIADLKVESGTVVSPGTSIGKIICTDEMEAEIPLKVDVVSWVKVGMNVKIFSQDKSQTWIGKVLRISDIVDQSSQSVNVYVKVNTAGSQVFDGMYISAEFQTNALHHVMELQRKALINNDKVYVVKDGKLVLKTISIHKLNNDICYFSGLEEGEMVVDESLINVHEGSEVKIQSTKH